jgi:hypothetical protein
MSTLSAADPVEVRRAIGVPVTDTRNHDHVEPLVRLDERVHQPHRVRRVHVVVDLPGRQQQMALQILGQLGVLLDAVLEGDVAVLVAQRR